MHLRLKSKKKQTEDKKNTRKRKILITLVLLLFLLLSAGMIRILQEPPYDTIYYTDDYPQLYKDQLQIIFGEDYLVGGKETITIEGENCNCGYHSDGLVYDEWQISYQDPNGQTFTQTLQNNGNLGSLQLSWLDRQLEQHCLKKYILDFFGEETFDDPSCYITIGNLVSGCRSEQSEEFKKVSEIQKEYLKQLEEQLQKEENLLHLAEADYKYFFSHFPIQVDFWLHIDDTALSEADKAILQKEVQEKTLKMIQTFGQDTDNACNLTIYISSADKNGLYDGSIYWQYYILQGEQIEAGMDFVDFEWKSFYSYEDIYW